MNKEMESETVTTMQLKTRPKQKRPRQHSQPHPLPTDHNRAVELLSRLTASDKPELDETEDGTLAALSQLVEVADLEEMMRTIHTH
jgi:hypothetical protein